MRCAKCAAIARKLGTPRNPRALRAIPNARPFFASCSSNITGKCSNSSPASRRILGGSMNREQFYAAMSGEGTLDYEKYLQTKTLLSCQSTFEDLCNADELQFQVVHQVEELWMKLIAYTLLDIDDFIQQENTNRVVTLFRRVHIALRLMINQLDLLETISPKEYQEIRLQLGNGSGQESPGFRTILKMHPSIWNSFKSVYLERHGLTVEKIYDSEYSHSDAY